MGKFPDILKKAEVTPDYKKDDLNDKQNYSPVTTLSSLKNLSGPMTPGEPCPTHSPSLHTHTHTHTHFCEKKKKKRNEGKKKGFRIRNYEKALTKIKMLLPAILERLEFKNCSSRPTMVAGNTFPFLPPLSNPFHRSCLFALKLIHI